MEKRLKSWQGWLLFGGSMVVVFVLGLCVSALMERRAELASVFNNRKTVIEGIEARNEVFKSDFPREYQTWTETAKTDFQSEFNGNVAVDVLEQRPEMVVLWAGYAFSKDYSTPRGHMHAIEDHYGNSSYRCACHCYGWPAAFYLLDLQEPRCAPHDGSYRCGCFL